MSHVDSVRSPAGSVLAVAMLLGTIASRLVPPGSAAAAQSRTRRSCWAAPPPVLALLGHYLHRRLLAGAAIIAAGYGGFFLIRTRQLRRADRDGVRRLLGLERCDLRRGDDRRSGSSRSR